MAVLWYIHRYKVDSLARQPCDLVFSNPWKKIMKPVRFAGAGQNVDPANRE